MIVLFNTSQNSSRKRGDEEWVGEGVNIIYPFKMFLCSTSLKQNNLCNVNSSVYRANPLLSYLNDVYNNRFTIINIHLGYIR